MPPTDRNRLLRTLQYLEWQIACTRQAISFPTPQATRAKAVASLAYLVLVRRSVEARLLAAGWFPQRPGERYRFVTVLLRVGRWSLITFFLAVAALFAILGSPLPNAWQEIIGISDIFLIAVSGILFIAIIFLRGYVAAGHTPWRFTVRNLLVLMTIVAMTLGLFAFAFR